MDADGGNVRRVFKGKIEAWRTKPTWSPDSKQFVFQCQDWNRRIKGGLYLGTFGEEDTEFIANYHAPKWSPDGSEIACSEHHPMGARLWFINVHTREKVQPLPDKTLLFQFEGALSAAWDRLAISGNRHPLPVILDRDLHNAWKDKQTIYIVNRDGTGLRQLVEEDGSYAQWPEFSPDGEEVLFTKEINWGFQIFKLHVNSGVRTQLTHIGGGFLPNFGGDWFDPAYANTLPVSPQPDLLTTTWAKMKKE
jgi:Tol biopolymer transport system component